jgi:hypothetical protein
MTDKAWKATERKKCRELGGERTGPRGFGLPDCVGVKVALEVKRYKRFVFLTKDWEQAVENATRVGLPPVLSVKESGRGGRDMVQMRVFDMSTLAGHAGEIYEVLQFGYLTDEQGYDLVRFPWADFARLYRAAYCNDKEKIG